MLTGDGYMTTSAGLIYIVEDEQQIAELLCDYLRESGYDSINVTDGSLAIEQIKEAKPDLVLLDVMLPGKDGMSICKELREFSTVPVIMITARVEEIDRLLGLELGADDYICKPFSPREVVARVKALLRRSSISARDVNFGIAIDENKYQIKIDGQVLDTTAVEFQLFNILFSKPGHIFNRESLMDKIYKDHRIVSDRTIDSHIKKLRKKIKQVVADKELIYSVYGVGYKFDDLN